MDIKFVIEIDNDCDEYRELYSAEVIMEDGSTYIVKATEDQVSYSDFRSDIFEDLFCSLAEATGLKVAIEEEDYSQFDIDDVDDLIEDYVAENSGC